MATVKILLGIICIAFIGNDWVPDRSLLIRTKGLGHLAERTYVLKVAKAEIGASEQTGRNDGLKVESYLQYIDLGKGHAWYAAFVSWVYGKSGYAVPRSGWSPALFPASRLCLEHMLNLIVAQLSILMCFFSS